MEWFKKKRKPREPLGERRLKVPDGLWLKCENCQAIVYKEEILRNSKVCPKCNYHFRISAQDRMLSLFDDGKYEIIDDNIRSCDPLTFKDTKKYKERLKESEEKTGFSEAVVTAVGEVGKIPVIISAMEYHFMGGSMGSVVGEKITRAIELALERRMPLIVVCSSGGARMQEGALSLMQMAKISSALARLDEAGIPYISILADPTTGGVAASFGMLGDLNISEPKALVGFAGPRVIEQTIRQELPPGFQRAEFLLEHGMIDMVIGRKELKGILINCLRFMIPNQ
ncbi:MAG: acetyl-CoA carboxylase, carboxyltransferase subunit beta [Candidatus Aminicenantes bacterium]|nr:acetyl-CoA carboxylase, carboxyltransferase subunit beta [Candidatus Aminicenantes bacterium]MDH5715001.1 acetyl-CoA carboxylase, carboxyltransferase subunit beta [Candidatus Aminicenantes bacterium]